MLPEEETQDARINSRGVRPDALATRAPMVRREEGEARWTEPARRLYDRWRAFQPWARHSGLYQHAARTKNRALEASFTD